MQKLFDSISQHWNPLPLSPEEILFSLEDSMGNKYFFGACFDAQENIFLTRIYGQMSEIQKNAHCLFAHWLEGKNLSDVLGKYNNSLQGVFYSHEDFFQKIDKASLNEIENIWVEVMVYFKRILSGEDIIWQQISRHYPLACACKGVTLKNLDSHIIPAMTDDSKKSYLIDKLIEVVTKETKASKSCGSCGDDLKKLTAMYVDDPKLQSFCYEEFWKISTKANPEGYFCRCKKLRVEDLLPSLKEGISSPASKESDFLKQLLYWQEKLHVGLDCSSCHQTLQNQYELRKLPEKTEVSIKMINPFIGKSGLTFIEYISSQREKIGILFCKEQEIFLQKNTPETTFSKLKEEFPHLNFLEEKFVHSASKGNNP